MTQSLSRLPVLVFGASGSIGQAICDRFIALEDEVFGVSRSQPASTLGQVKWLNWDCGQSVSNISFAAPNGFRAIVWSQGINFNDEIEAFDLRRHMSMYEANVGYILESLSELLKAGAVPDGGRLCVISSIWQDIARQKKLSYCVTKSALAGLVRSLAIDLGHKKICVNAVLPGPLDTPMTRANLSKDQIEKLEGSMPLQSLPALDDVSALVEFLCSDRNSGITGQFIAADRGYSDARFV